MFYVFGITSIVVSISREVALLVEGLSLCD